MSTRRSSDFARFKELFDKSKRIVALTGAGVSAESGVPTFRGEGGLWRRYQATSLATPQSFASDPSLVWQFYEYRRQLVATKVPNDAHKTLAYIESQFKSAGSDRTINIITQNVDELHRRAGTTNLLEIHGTLYKTRCTKCKKVESNNTNPIVPSLANISPIDNDESKNKRIALEDLPHCGSCGAMLRPHIVWFNESLDPEVLNEADRLLAECDLFLVIGTSSIVYPAAMFAPQVASRGVTVAEFNLEPTSASKTNGYFFEGPCGQTLPKALGVDVNQLN